MSGEEAERRGVRFEAGFVLGYCFAHDPESAEWRAMGGRARSKRKRTMKRLRESDMGHVLEALEEALEELRSGEGDPSKARAKARVAESILRVMDWMEDGGERGSGVLRMRKWEPY